MIDRRSVLHRPAALPRLGTAAALLLATTAAAQQGPGGGGPPPDRSTPVQANELRETWNDRVSAGPPIDALREFDGWSMGTAVIGGRIFLPGGGITLGGNSGTNAMQVYRPTMRCE
jgi:hypothetical protein